MRGWSEPSLRNATRQLVELFYQVRNNRDHWLKQRTARNKLVATRTYHAMEQFLDAALARPSHSLCVYGTLRHNKVNHHWIEDLGDPVAGSIRGIVSEKHGYPIFEPTRDGDEIDVELYSSDRLTPKRWQELDKFEGPAYRRMLVPVRQADGSHTIATTYADADPSDDVDSSP